LPDVASFIAGLVLGIAIPVIADILKAEYSRLRKHSERMGEFRGEAQAVINSMANAWAAFGQAGIPGMDLAQDFQGYVKDLNEYLGYYLAYGGKKEVVEEMNNYIAEMLKLLPHHRRKDVAKKIGEIIQKLQNLSNRL